MPPDAVVPPPILPAPDLPDADPLIELPPEGESPVAGAPVVPGLPVDGNGAVFSFADLAEELLGSVGYISTSQRVAISRQRPTPPSPDSEGDNPHRPPGDDFFDDFFESRRTAAAIRRPSSRSAPVLSSTGRV